MELKGRVALVTGAGRRLGQAIAVALAEAGMDLMIHFHASTEGAAHTVEQAAARGVRAERFQADLTRIDEVRRLFQAFDSLFPGLDVLVNSAAILEAVDLLAASEDDWDRTIQLNLKGAFFCLQQAALRMRPRGGGAIVNISDVAGLRPWRRYPIHSISKAGVEMMTRVAALALAPDIRVNAVAPGPVLRPETMDAARWQAIADALPMRRAGEPYEVTQAVLHLLHNDYITGETIVVDGGDTLR